MKRVLLTLALIIAATRAEAQTVENDLVGLGMNPAIAEYLAGIIPAGAALDNNVFLKSDNQAGSGTLNLLKADTSDNTMINAGSGKKVRVAIATTPEVDFTDDMITAIGNTLVVVAPTAIAMAPGSATTPVAKWQSDGIAFQSSTVGMNQSPYVATPATNLTPVAGTNDFRRYTLIAAAGPTAQAIALPNSPNDGDQRHLVNSSANPLIVASISTPVINQGTNRTTSVAAKSGLRCVYSSAVSSWICDVTGAMPTPIGG